MNLVDYTWEGLLNTQGRRAGANAGRRSSIGRLGLFIHITAGLATLALADIDTGNLLYPAY